MGALFVSGCNAYRLAADCPFVLMCLFHATTACHASTGGVVSTQAPHWPATPETVHRARFQLRVPIRRPSPFITHPLHAMKHLHCRSAILACSRRLSNVLWPIAFSSSFLTASTFLFLVQTRPRFSVHTFAYHNIISSSFGSHRCRRYGVLCVGSYSCFLVSCRRFIRVSRELRILCGQQRSLAYKGLRWMNEQIKTGFAKA